MIHGQHGFAVWRDDGWCVFNITDTGIKLIAQKQDIGRAHARLGFTAF